MLKQAIWPNRVACLIIALALTATPFQQTGVAYAQTKPATTVELGRPEALGLGQRAIALGRYDLAKRIAVALLALRSDDAEALLLLSAAEARLGKDGASLTAANRAMDAADSDATKFEATFLKAMAHANAGNTMRAKYYLRRANDLAPDPQARTAVKQSYGQLVNQSKLRFSIDLNAGPSRNLNGGSLHESLVILPGLALPLAQALPGFTYGGTARFSYRLSTAPSAITELTGGLRHRSVQLSDRAKVLAPGLRNADLAYSSVDLGIMRRWKLENTPVVLSLGATVTQHWYGGDEHSNQIRGDFSATRVLKKDRVVKLGFYMEQTNDALRSVRDIKTVGINGSLYQGLGKWGRAELTLSARRDRSDAGGLAKNAQGIQLGWQPQIRPGQIAMNFGVGAERRDYYRTPALDPDLKLDAFATFTMTGVNYMGFSPEFRMQATRIKSDFKPRDTFDFGLGIGIRSAF